MAAQQHLSQLLGIANVEARVTCGSQFRTLLRFRWQFKLFFCSTQIWKIKLLHLCWLVWIVFLLHSYRNVSRFSKFIAIDLSRLLAEMDAERVPSGRKKSWKDQKIFGSRFWLKKSRRKTLFFACHQWIQTFTFSSSCWLNKRYGFIASAMAYITVDEKIFGAQINPELIKIVRKFFRRIFFVLNQKCLSFQ